MKTILFIILLGLPITMFSQEKNHTLYIILQKNENENKISLIYQEDILLYNLITLTKLDPNDFNFICRYKDDEQDLYVFEEYSSPAGLKNFYYFDINNKRLLKSKFFSEDEIPLLVTTNIKTHKLQYISIKSSNCGSFESSNLNVIWDLNAENNLISSLHKDNIIKKIQF